MKSLVVLALVGALAASVLVPGGSDGAAEAFRLEDQVSERIVFSGSIGGESGLFTVSPDGTDVRRVTLSPGWDGQPSWSPDGRRLAFVREVDGVSDIWTADPDGKSLVAVTSDEFNDRAPSWSPDGLMLAFTSDRDTYGDLSGLRQVFVSDVSGERPRRVSDLLVSDSSAVWLNAETLMVAGMAPGSRSFELYEVDIAAGEATRLTELGGVFDPTLSPAGDEVVFVRAVRSRDSEVWELWSLDRDSGRGSLIDSDIGGAHSPVFSPDGTRLAFGSGECGLVLCIANRFEYADFEAERLVVSRSPISQLDSFEAPDWAPVAVIGGDPVLNRGTSPTLATTTAEPQPRAVAIGRTPESDDSGGLGVGVTSAAAAVSPTVSVSGLWGGGFANVMEVANRSGFNWLFSGGDTSGIHRSWGATNQWGTNWQPRNKGLANPFLSRSVAAIAAHPDPTSKAVYTATSGGFYWSDDNAKSWTLQHPSGNEPEFIGNNAGASEEPLPARHPRSIGRLIVVNWDPTRTPATVLYVGSARDGIWRSVDDGDTWVRVALAGHHIRTLVAVPDPAHPTDRSKDWLLAGSLGETPEDGGPAHPGNGIWRIKQPHCGTENCATGVGRLWGNDNNLFQPEEFFFDAPRGRVWCACGEKGVRYAEDGDDYGIWSGFSGNTGLPGQSPLGVELWSSIAVVDYEGDGNLDVIAGASDSDEGAGTGVELLRRADADVANPAVWEDLVTPTQRTYINTSAQVCGTSTSFWLTQDTTTRPTLLAHSRFEPGHIEVGIDDQLYVAGDAAPWRLDRTAGGVNSFDGLDWCAAVEDHSSTANRGLAKGPTGDQLVIGNTDFDAFHSSDGLSTFTRISIDKTTVGFDVHYTRSNGEVVVGTGERDSFDASGEVEDVVIFTSGVPISDLDLDIDPDEPEVQAARVIGVSSAERGTTTPNEIYVAAVSGNGVWRRNSGSNPVWTQVLSPMEAVGSDLPDGANAFDRADIHWDDQWVFLLDRSTGLWRSDDWAKPGSWEKIWTPAVGPNPGDDELPTTGAERRFIGFLAVDPGDPDRLYISTRTEVVEIDDATTCSHPCSFVAIDELGGTDRIAKPGPIAVSPDGEYLLVATRLEANGDNAEIWRYDDIDGSASWYNGTHLIDESDDVYPNMAFTLTGMTITQNNRVFISTQGIGVIRIDDAIPLPAA